MALLRVVEEFDVIKDVSPGCLLNGVNLAANPLPFEELEETLGDGVVVTIAAPAHAGNQLVRLQEELPFMTGELTALVGMNDHGRFGLPTPERHQQGVGGQVCFRGRLHRQTGDLP